MLSASKGILAAGVTGVFLGAFYLLVGDVDVPQLFTGEELRGSVTHVRDADTIVVSGIPIRLNGVSAPELDTAMGQEGKRYLQTLVLHKQVVCSLNGERTHDRKVGVCSLNGKDLGAEVIRAGHAADCPRYSNGRYKRFETEKARRWPLPNYCKIR